MKKGFTLVEFLIVISIIVLIVANLIPCFVGKKNDKNINESPSIHNDKLVKKCQVEKLFEFRGYDVYTFIDDMGHKQSLQIPVTNSVYALEKQ